MQAARFDLRRALTGTLLAVAALASPAQPLPADCSQAAPETVTAAAAAAAPTVSTLVDANTASRAALESLPGVGPAMAERLLQARAQAAFSSWADLQARVRGVGSKRAGQLSRAGLRVQTQAFAPVQTAGTGSVPGAASVACSAPDPE